LVVSAFVQALFPKRQAAESTQDPLEKITIA
jgi:hypothetical protein